MLLDKNDKIDEDGVKIEIDNRDLTYLYYVLILYC